MKNLYLFLCILCSFSLLEAKQKKEYDLAICAITRDDAIYLKEWVDFHLHQGVQHIYIYDNFSSDHPEITLKEHIRKGYVEIIKWNIDHKTHDEWLNCQCEAYNDCALKKKDAVKWCAFIDTDEFLFCPSGQKLTQFLKEFEPYQEVAVNWLVYGTSNVKKVHPGKMTQELLYRTKTDMLNDCKCIVRLKDAIKSYSPHYFLIKDHKLFVNANKQRITPEDFSRKAPNIDKIRINHYMYRDLDFLYNSKIARLKQQGKGSEYILHFEKLSNVCYDDSILKCLPKKPKKP